MENKNLKQKDEKTSIKRQSSVLITCISCIVLLMVICYFGISGVKETFSVTYTCPSGYNSCSGSSCICYKATQGTWNGYCWTGYSPCSGDLASYCPNGTSSCFKLDSRYNSSSSCSGAGGTWYSSSSSCYFYANKMWSLSCPSGYTDDKDNNGWCYDYLTDGFIAKFYGVGSTFLGSKTCAGEGSCSISPLTGPTKNGYIFNGWGTYDGCTSGNKNSSISLSSNKDFYACYVEDSSDPKKTFTANFLNGTVQHGWKSCSGIDSCTVVTPSAPKKDGYKFKGWGTSNGCTSGKSADTSITLTKTSNTYYACWEATSCGPNKTGSDYCSWCASDAGQCDGYTNNPLYSCTAEAGNLAGSYRCTCKYSTKTACETALGGTCDESVNGCYEKVDNGKVYAKFYDGDSVKAFPSCTIEDGKDKCQITTPPALTRSGNTFGGWSKDDCKTKSAGNVDIYIQGGEKYYACWEKYCYRCFENANDQSNTTPDAWKWTTSADSACRSVFGTGCTSESNCYKDANIVYESSCAASSNNPGNDEPTNPGGGNNDGGGGGGNQPSNPGGDDEPTNPGDSNTPNNPDSDIPSVDDNVTENPVTGSIAIFIVWVITLVVIIYGCWYIKRLRTSE